MYTSILDKKALKNVPKLSLNMPPQVIFPRFPLKDIEHETQHKRGGRGNCGFKKNSTLKTFCYYFQSLKIF